MSAIDYRELREKLKREASSDTSLASPFSQRKPDRGWEGAFDVSLSFPPPDFQSPIDTSSFKCELLDSACFTGEGLYYIPDFITEAQEDDLLQCIDESGNHNPKVCTVLSSRRLQCWGGMVGSDVPGSYKEPLPLFLKQIIKSLLVSSGIFENDEENVPDHTLINFYDDGQGILHHTDGPRYRPRVAILSLSSSCIMTFKPYLKPNEVGEKDCKDLFSVVLNPRSLLIFENEVYESLMHGIYPTKFDVVGQIPGTLDDATNTHTQVPCVNCHLAKVNVGDVITRGKRVSLTFRKALWS